MSNLTVFFPTNNIGKFSRYEETFKKAQIKYHRYLKDKDGKDMKIEVEENGNSTQENAEIKARTYYEYYKRELPPNTHFVIMTSDEALFFHDLPDGIEQPGLFVRRFNGLKGGRATDKEVVERYTSFIKDLKQNQAKAFWQYSFVAYNGESFEYINWEEEVLFSDTPHEPITEGYPLNNITIVGQIDEYNMLDLTSNATEYFKNQSDKNVMLSDLTDEAREKYLSQYTQNLVDFVNKLSKQQNIEEFIIE